MFVGNFCKNAVIAATLTLGFAGTVSAGILYQDGFSRGTVGTPAILQGTAPDVVNSAGALWQQEQGGQVFRTNGSTANNTGVYGEIYLPVNGGSGVGSAGPTLDGTVDFTFSVLATQGNTSTTPPTMGIILNTSVNNSGNIFNDSAQPGVFAGLGLNNGNAVAVDGRAHGDFADGVALTAGNPITLTLKYTASLGTITYTVSNGLTLNNTFYTTTGVTAANIAALRYVSLDNGSFATNNGTFDNFLLSTATPAPEPSTYAMMLGGLAGLALVIRRRQKHS